MCVKAANIFQIKKLDLSISSVAIVMLLRMYGTFANQALYFLHPLYLPPKALHVETEKFCSKWHRGPYIGKYPLPQGGGDIGQCHLGKKYEKAKRKKRKM
jgi:hypothetical protein